MVTAILDSGQAGPLTRPVLITTAGAPPSPTTIAEMERMGFNVVHVYGLTETYGPISVCQPQPHWADLPAGQRAVLQARQGVGMIQAGNLRVGQSATPEELIAHVRTKIAGYKVPRDIDITEGLPKTPTGKIQKYLLREEKWRI